MSNLGSERSRHNESHYELVISHPSPPQTTLDLQKQRALCVLGPAPALRQRKKVYLVCAPTRYWHILLPLGWVLSSSVRARPDRCCHGCPLARQMQPLCRSWLLPSSACQCPETVCACVVTCGQVVACDLLPSFVILATFRVLAISERDV